MAHVPYQDMVTSYTLRTCYTFWQEFYTFVPIDDHPRYIDSQQYLISISNYSVCVCVWCTDEFL